MVLHDSEIPTRNSSCRIIFSEARIHMLPVLASHILQNAPEVASHNIAQLESTTTSACAGVLTSG